MVQRNQMYDMVLLNSLFSGVSSHHAERYPDVVLWSLLGLNLAGAQATRAGGGQSIRRTKDSQAQQRCLYCERCRVEVSPENKG